MKLKALSIAILFSLSFVICQQDVNAQTFSAELLREIPESAESLNSPDVRERAKILKKMVVPVQESCSGEQDLPVNLDKEDYEFVVGKILELDLSALDYKEDVYIWEKISFLITNFKMFRHLETFSKYLNHSEIYVQFRIIYIIERLNARDLDSKLVPLLDSLVEFIREQTLTTLIELKSSKAVPPLIKRLENPNYMQRYYALMNLVKVNGIDAAPNISKLLNDEHEDVRYTAIDTLVKLNAKSQADKLWKYLETETNERFTGYAIAALLYFGEKNAVPVALKIFRENAKNEGNFHVFEFVYQLQPKILIPAMIALYHQKEKFYESDEYEKRMRLNIYNFLYNYKTRDAIPIYRENLFVNKPYSETTSFQEGIAQILLGLNAVEVVDDLIIGLSDTMKNKEASYYDMKVGIIAYYLAKFGDKKANKILIEVVEENNSQYRSSIIAELNRQLNPELWKKLDAEKLPVIEMQSIESFSEKASAESGIKISFEKEETSEKVSCFSDDIMLTNAIPCSYSDGRMSVLQSLGYIFSDRRNQKYTWIFDTGKVRILSVEKAIDWWRKNHLSE